MVKQAHFTKNKSNGNNHFKSVKNKQTLRKVRGSSVVKSNKRQTFISKNIGKPPTVDKSFKSRLPEDNASDSEPDAFSQLVSCFTGTSNSVSAISDDEYDSSDSETKSDISITTKAMESDDDAGFECVESDEPNKKGLSHQQILVDDSEVYSAGSDPFEDHIQYDLDNDLYDAVSSTPQNVEKSLENWPVLGNLKCLIPKPSQIASNLKLTLRIDSDITYAKPGKIPSRIEQVSENDWLKLSVKSQIWAKILDANAKHANVSLTKDDQLTHLQKELFSIFNNYQDLYFPNRSLDNGEEVRFVYCLHAVNHALKTRLKVTNHNLRLSNKPELKGEVPDEFRDQGLIRPKILILVPFRNSALRVVNIIISILLGEESSNVLNKKRFLDEYNSAEIAMPKKNPKPEDYERTFVGDTDDNFKIGISVTKKSLKLYADFYSADIIIGSPLGLRVLVGAEGQADRDYDFLASIELLIVDQAEIIFMQNWDHLLHVWDHLHMQPKESHGTNFARVRPWALSGRTRFYRQTLLFSTHSLPQLSALFSRKCHNYAGKIWVDNPITAGTICQIVLQLPQVFNRIGCDSPTDSIDVRFNYFIDKILPQYKEPMMNHTVIYVPSYFDYVRIRNYFKKETVSFVQICEYSKDGKIARARDMFFHSSAHFLLYSERFHYFRRIRLKGIRHIIFYQPPTIPHFYSELCNLMQQDVRALSPAEGFKRRSATVETISWKHRRHKSDVPSVAKQPGKYVEPGSWLSCTM